MFIPKKNPPSYLTFNFCDKKPRQRQYCLWKLKVGTLRQLLRTQESTSGGNHSKPQYIPVYIQMENKTSVHKQAHAHT